MKVLGLICGLILSACSPRGWWDQKPGRPIELRPEVYGTLISCDNDWWVPWKRCGVAHCVRVNKRDECRLFGDEDVVRTADHRQRWLVSADPDQQIRRCQSERDAVYCLQLLSTFQRMRPSKDLQLSLHRLLIFLMGPDRPKEIDVEVSDSSISFDKLARDKAYWGLQMPAPGGGSKYYLFSTKIQD